MEKIEFEERAGTTVSLRDYSIIEKVYAWHPAISETEGKEQIAEIYKKYGMVVIYDMLETASLMENLDTERRKIVSELEKLNKRIGLVCKGNLVYEKCRREIEDVYDGAESREEYEWMKRFAVERYGATTVGKVEEDMKIQEV